MNEQMNRENLSRMADYIETVPQKKFNMRLFRTGEEKNHECGSGGCILGHCTILDKNPLPLDSYGDINFSAWSLEFTGLNPFCDEWNYLFSGDWDGVDNTPAGAAKRIRHFLEKGLPDDWRGQIEDSAPLSYLKNKTA